MFSSRARSIGIGSFTFMLTFGGSPFCLFYLETLKEMDDDLTDLRQVLIESVGTSLLGKGGFETCSQIIWNGIEITDATSGKSKG